jgi:hypothetical protein
MLLEQWFALNTIEFEHEVSDRMSFRRFIGLKSDQGAPDHASVRLFAQVLVERGIAVEMSNELKQQLQMSGLVSEQDSGEQSEGDFTLPRGLFDSARGLGVLGPVEWMRIEQQFLDYWNKRRGEDRFPTTKSVKPGDIPELEPYLSVVRMTASGTIKYEFVGSAIEQANGGRLVGTTINDRLRRNITEFGHPGLQSELLNLSKRVAKQEKPCGLSCVYNNFKGKKCQFWTVQAPVGDENGKVNMLIGVALVLPLSVN